MKKKKKKKPNACAVFTMEFSMPLAEGGSIADAMREILELARSYGAARTIGAVTMDHGVDEDNLVAVGANNAVLVTENGGQTWASVTGPRPIR